MEFCIKSDDCCYVASWSNISVNGIGKTPIKAVDDLNRKLNEALSDKDMLMEIGREIVEMILTEMHRWR